MLIKSKTGLFLKSKLKLLSPETIKLLGTTKKDIDQNKDGKDVPKLLELFYYIVI